MRALFFWTSPSTDILIKQFTESNHWPSSGIYHPRQNDKSTIATLGPTKLTENISITIGYIND